MAGRTFGARLKDAMLARGMTARALADATDTNRTTVGDYIKDRTSPTVRWAVLAADVLAIPAAFLLIGAGRTGLETDLGSQLREQAPGIIPAAERERFMWLAQSVRLDCRVTGERGVATTMRMLTAPMAELRRARREPKGTPDAMLEALRTYQPQAFRDYITFTLLAAEKVVRPGRLHSAPATKNNKRRKQ